MSDKTKVQFEYLIKSSPRVLYNRLSTASGLSEWFADNVAVRGKKFTFIWDGVEQHAERTINKDSQLVRFLWLEEDDGAYFEFQIHQDELTGDVSLMVTDFADDDEIEDVQNLWDSQISDLKRILGS